MSLYTDLKASGVEIDSHCSDLYVKSCPESLAILRLPRYKLQKSNAVTFINQLDKSVWIDIPFAYDPYWEGKVK